MNPDIDFDPGRVEVDSDHFRAWWHYFGLLAETVDPDPVSGDVMTSRLFGFETVTQSLEARAEVPDDGACFGFVVHGGATLVGPGLPAVPLSAGMWFATPNGASLELEDLSRVVVNQRVEFLGLRAFGGPIEQVGRLRYIDRCSDTLLMPPPRAGDACLNHLHFPSGVEQTAHTHPSVRMGCVAAGEGWCETPAGASELLPGVLFCIPRDGHHRFLTSGRSLDVIAYHPDSDWGPTDEEHPMINRTWVEGQKVDNTGGLHATAEVASTHVTG